MCWIANLKIRVQIPFRTMSVSLMVKYPAFNRCVIGSNPIQANNYPVAKWHSVRLINERQRFDSFQDKSFLYVAEGLLRRFAKSWTIMSCGFESRHTLWASLKVGYRSVAPVVWVRFPCSVFLGNSLIGKIKLCGSLVKGSIPFFLKTLS